MSHGYVPVNWNRRKQLYDACVWLCIVGYIALFLGVSNMLYRGTDSITIQILLMRAFSTCAFLMLTVILCIGPLARINRRFLPLLYNRRHLGVSLFVVALLHAAVVVYWYHSFGVVNPIVSIFTSGGVEGAAGADGADNIYRSLDDFPFQAFGAVALVILFLMAATSHDYWNANLGGPLWKAIHMLVYAAYALVIVHITFGALQQDNTGLLPWMAWVSVLLVGGLHLFAGLARAGVVVKLDGAKLENARDGDMREWVIAGRWQDIPNNRAVTVSIADDERIAIFRYDETKLAAVSNVCQHQNGPLGEGRVVDGLITCPWHGYQYKPEDGCSPPPFTEKVKTYRLKVEGDKILVNPTPLPAGSPRPVTEITET